MSASATWTDENLKALREMWDGDWSATEIAKALGTTRNAVLGKVHRLVLPKRKEHVSRAPRQRHTLKRDRNRFIPTRTYARVPNKPLPKPAPEPIACEPRNLTILELKSGHCRWISERNGLDTIYCAADVKAESSYCPAHHALVYVKPKPLDRRPGKEASDVRREGGGKSAALAFLNE